MYHERNWGPAIEYQNLTFSASTNQPLQVLLVFKTFWGSIFTFYGPKGRLFTQILSMNGSFLASGE